MTFMDRKIESILKILHDEVVPAQGCTEPIAIAFATAKAREVILNEDIIRVVILVSGNMIKNVKSVVVPGSGGMVGIEVSAVMGFMFGDASKKIFKDVTDKKTRNMLIYKAYLDGYSQHQIAKVLNISQPAVYGIIKRNKDVIIITPPQMPLS